MLSVNPFAVAGASLPAGFLQGFLVVMVLAVVAGTLFDIVHKGSARYFFANLRRSKDRGQQMAGGELVSIAVQTAVVDVLASGEFCNPKRRV
ncbi:MAG TPA: adenylyl-sulfate reductase, partial [Casimicrobiaceae bacterium]|nr:adenylyl-sulfate reductase [Casimicrobiaceae bacterium]